MTLGGLTPGRYLLAWSYLTTGQQWKAVSEVAIGGTVRFRHAKSHASDKPINHDATVIEVLP